MERFHEEQEPKQIEAIEQEILELAAGNKSAERVAKINIIATHMASVSRGE